MKKNLIYDLSVGITVGLIVAALGMWLQFRSLSPIIEVDYSRTYATINNTRIGYIFIGNAGKTTDKNISVTIDTIVEKDSINIPQTISDFKITNTGGETTITLESLRPSEVVTIFFSPKESDTYEWFDVVDTLSDSNNFYDLQYVGYWDINFETKIILLSSILLSFFLGLYIMFRFKTNNSKK